MLDDGFRVSWHSNYIPLALPCGKQINQNRNDQCCKTECPAKSAGQLNRCYLQYKYAVEGERR